MEIKEAIRKRKSIRGYKSDPVPREVLIEIIQTAIRAPSAVNNQPWEIIVLTGEPLEKVRTANCETLTSGAMPNLDIDPEWSYEGVYKDRSRQVGFALYDLLGIKKDDREKRNEWMMKGFRAFDAPAAIILAFDASLNPITASFDIGGLVQTICLVALDYGLGTCINRQGVMYPDIIRQVTGLPKSKKMCICIAIGYPDGDHPANKLDTQREAIENNTSWYGFN